MKVIIAGGRDYHFSKDDYDFLEELDNNTFWDTGCLDSITEVITGGCRGADADAEKWAKSKIITVNDSFHVPQWVWDEWGKVVGPKRNHHMALYGKKHNAIVVLFPGGRGTSNMFREAVEHQLEVILAPSWNGRHP